MSTRWMQIRKKRKSGFTVPTTSMGDIAFLLIIFFVVASQFTRDTSVRVTPPQSTYVSILENARVTVSIDAEGNIYLQGQKVESAKAIEWGVASLMANASTDADRTVIFRCDRTVDRSVFQPVIEAITQGGGIVAAVGEDKK